MLIIIPDGFTCVCTLDTVPLHHYTTQSPKQTTTTTVHKLRKAKYSNVQLVLEMEVGTKDCGCGNLTTLLRYKEE